jgi:hypothetical protein
MLLEERFREQLLRVGPDAPAPLTELVVGLGPVERVRDPGLLQVVRH